jgi:hypothetical protein
MSFIYQCAITEPIWILYRNHKELVRWRHIQPIKLRFGGGPYSDAMEWWLVAEALEHNREKRDFPLARIQGFSNTNPA